MERDKWRKMERKKYFYNVRTHRLHIYGNCRESKWLPVETKFFDSINEALAFDGSAVGVCKNCQKKEDRKGNAICLK